MKAEQLIAGKMYQVRFSSLGYTYTGDWVLAEYMSMVEAHDYKYSNMYLGGKTGIEIGPEKVKHQPTMYYFKTAWNGSRFGITDLKDVRETSQEAVAEVEQLRRLVKEAEAAVLEAKRNLKDFCI